jgi:hypothetical protein
VGAVASAALLVVEIRIIGSICLLCEAVHVTSWVLLGVAVAGRRRLEPVTRRVAAWTLFAPAVAVGAARLGLPRYWALLDWQAPVTLPVGTDDEQRPWIGATHPVVVVEEYLDYTCPACARATVRTRRWLGDLVDRVRFVRHHVAAAPCMDSDATCQPIRLALCAGEQVGFWKIDAWLWSHTPGRPRADVDQAVTDLGLNAGQLTVCLTASATFEAARRQTTAARVHGAGYTPRYVIDGKTLKLSQLEERLEQLASAQRRARAAGP